MDSAETALATRPNTDIERLDRYRAAADTAAAAIEAGKKTNTTRAYRTDLARFGAFATGTTLPHTSAPNRNDIIDALVLEGENQLPADPSTLAAFVGDMIEKAGSWATGSSVVTDYLDEADLWANNALALLSTNEARSQH